MEERKGNLLDGNNLIGCLDGSPSGYPQLGVLLDGGAGRPGAAGVVIRKLGVGLVLRRISRQVLVELHLQLSLSESFVAE